MNTICSGLYSQVHANTDKVPACSSRLGVLCLLDWLACKRLPAAPGQLAWASSVGGWVHPLACYAMFARTSAAFGSSWHTHEVITSPPSLPGRGLCELAVAVRGLPWAQGAPSPSALNFVRTIIVCIIHNPCCHDYHDPFFVPEASASHACKHSVHSNLLCCTDWVNS